MLRALLGRFMLWCIEGVREQRGATVNGALGTKGRRADAA
jgi:hypothetical protein